MIIEDNKILSDMYKFKFDIEWYQVFIENNSENAINSYKSFNPDIIILDLMMPWINGFDILELLQKEENKAKIIVLSNLNEQKDKDKSISLWADKFLLKANLSPKELVTEINSL